MISKISESMKLLRFLSFHLLYYCSTGKLNSVDQRKNTEKVQFVQPRLFNSLKSDISGTSLSNPIEHDTSNQIRIE